MAAEPNPFVYDFEAVDSKEPGGIPLLRCGGTRASYYQGEITINPGDRICQMVIAPVPDISMKVVPRNRLSVTDRGEGGFGSTGVSSQ